VTPVNGVVPIEVSCQFRATCEGALVLDLAENGPTTGIGRSDLVVPAHSTVTLGVPLSAAGQQALSRGREVPASVTADTGKTLFALSSAERSNWLAVDAAAIKLAGQ
jgi:hypothetical protein